LGIDLDLIIAKLSNNLIAPNNSNTKESFISESCEYVRTKFNLPLMLRKMTHNSELINKKRLH